MTKLKPFKDLRLKFEVNEANYSSVPIHTSVKPVSVSTPSMNTLTVAKFKEAHQVKKPSSHKSSA